MNKYKIFLLFIIFFLSLTIGYSQNNKFNEELIEGCELGNVKKVKKALNNGADINYISTEGMPLYVAIKYNNTNVAKLLLTNEYIDVNPFNSSSPLLMAVQKGNFDIVKILVDEKRVPFHDLRNKEDENVHVISAKNNNFDIFLYFTDKWFSKENIKKSIPYVVKYQKNDIFSLLVKKGISVSNNTYGRCLHYAVVNNNMEIAKYYFEHDGKMNRATMEYICKNNLYDYLYLWIKEIKHTLAVWSDDEPNQIFYKKYLATPLYFAKDEKMLEYLFSMGVDPNQVVYKNMYLSNENIFCDAPFNKYRKYYYKKYPNFGGGGPEPYSDQSKYQLSPLSKAVVDNQLWKVKYLLNHGAKVELKSDKSGYDDAEFHAKRKNRNTMLLLLRKHK